MDSENPIVKLCAEGMQAEATGDHARARALFARAWDAHRDDYEACIAAHYLARQQESPADVLHWNQLALQHAEAADDEKVREFYASLYLNLGWSHEILGDLEEANRCYELAEARLGDVPDGPYREVVAGGIAAGKERLHSQSANKDGLS